MSPPDGPIITRAVANCLSHAVGAAASGTIGDGAVFAAEDSISPAKTIEGSAETTSAALEETVDTLSESSKAQLLC